MRDDSRKRIVELPAKGVTVDTPHFIPAEQKTYNSIYNAAKRNFDQLDVKGLIGQTKPSGYSKDGAIDADTLMNDISEHDLSSANLDMSTDAGCSICLEIATVTVK
ncbi:hypothetical protein DFJ58DRAFT_831217, partial [Suillus subalutaceus]|uniref:uncharacterized protein n=1 Tax=Suillus subalutaceus TaxID=48586 RepID=UPI001B87A1EF